jgi:hypothetical protein
MRPILLRRLDSTEMRLYPLWLVLVWSLVAVHRDLNIPPEALPACPFSRPNSIQTTRQLPSPSSYQLSSTLTRQLAYSRMEKYQRSSFPNILPISGNLK